MVVLNEELLRKRAEHNDGILPDLEEVALHQNEIERIEPSLAILCRHLKILLLQNNIIGKMENLSKLKELEYLNLALNNIQKIENIEGCESLKKLDLTVNFIDLDNLESSIMNLRSNQNLEDLYLVGNPCADWWGCREFVIASLEQLKQLDGTLINPSERIKARQSLPFLLKELCERAERIRRGKLYDKQYGVVPPEDAYTIESRVEMYREQAKVKEEKELKEKEARGEIKSERKVTSAVNSKGEIRQCNEGKIDFVLDDWSSKSEIVLSVPLPKLLDSSYVDVDVHPGYVRVVIKSKLLQLKLSEQVSVAKTQVLRSKASGMLKVVMPLSGEASKELNPQKRVEKEQRRSEEKNRSSQGFQALVPMEEKHQERTRKLQPRKKKDLQVPQRSLPLLTEIKTKSLGEEQEKESESGTDEPPCLEDLELERDNI